MNRNSSPSRFVVWIAVVAMAALGIGLVLISVIGSMQLSDLGDPENSSPDLDDYSLPIVKTLWNTFHSDSETETEIVAHVSKVQATLNIIRMMGVVMVGISMGLAVWQCCWKAQKK